MATKKVHIATNLTTRDAPLHEADPRKGSMLYNAYIETFDREVPVIRKRPALEHKISAISPACYGLWSDEYDSTAGTLYFIRGDGTYASLHSLTTLDGNLGEDGSYITQENGDDLYIESGTDVLLFYTQGPTEVYIGSLASGSGHMHDFARTDTGKFVVKNGSKAFYYNGSALSRIDTSTYPGNTCTGMAYIDGVLVVGQNDKLYTSTLDSTNGPIAWDALDVISSNLYGDDLHFICEYKNHVVAFSSHSIEFFYYAGNPTGSPLSRRSDIAHKVGVTGYPTTGTGTVPAVWKAQHSDLIAFIANESDAAPYVAMLDNFKVKKISTPAIDKYLAQSKSSASNTTYHITGFASNGRTYIAVYMQTSDASVTSHGVTFVYDTVSEAWYTWASSITTGHADVMHFRFYAAAFARAGTSGNSVDLKSVVQDGDGEIYILHDDEYQDTEYGGATRAITSQIITDKVRGENHSRKFMSALRVIGETETGSSVTVKWSDDDYGTFSTGISVDMSSVAKNAFQLGSFRERAFLLEHSSNTPLGINYIEVDFDEGII